MAKSKKQTLWVMLNEREIHKVYECTKYNGYTEVEDCTLPKPYNPLRYIVKNSQIVDDPRKLKDEIARLTAENDSLKSENAELHAKLKKAVVLPCKVGDTVYWIEKWRTEPQIDEYTVHGFMIDTTNQKVCIRVKLDKNGFFVPLVGEYKDKQLFFDRTKAEARLAELKGGGEGE